MLVDVFDVAWSPSNLWKIKSVVFDVSRVRGDLQIPNLYIPELPDVMMTLKWSGDSTTYLSTRDLPQCWFCAVGPHIFFLRLSWLYIAGAQPKSLLSGRFKCVVQTGPKQSVWVKTLNFVHSVSASRSCCWVGWVDIVSCDPEASLVDFKVLCRCGDQKGNRTEGNSACWMPGLSSMLPIWQSAVQTLEERTPEPSRQLRLQSL